MTVREIVTVGHPVLRERARDVTIDELATPDVQRLIDDLVDTMRAANGAGIAANQIGVPLRITTIEVNDNPSIDHRYEDGVLGDELYRAIMADFRRRLEQRRRPPEPR